MFFNTKKKHDDALLRLIHELIAAGEKQRILDGVRFTDAQRFAVENGAALSSYRDDPENDCLLFDARVGGAMYRVCFQRWMQNDVLISVESAKASSDRLLSIVGEDSEVGQMIKKQQSRSSGNAN